MRSSVSSPASSRPSTRRSSRSPGPSRRTTSRAAPTIDVTTGLGYPKKADDARAHPERLAAVLRPHRIRASRAASAVLVQGTATIDDEDLKANADRYMRESAREAARDQEDAPAEAPARAVQLLLRADLHQGPPRAGLRLAGWRPDERAHDPRRPSRGGPLGPQRGAARAARLARRAARRPGTSGWSSSDEHETGVLSWLAPTAFRSPSASRTRPIQSRREIRIEAEPRGPAAARGAGLPDRPPARPGLHLAAQHAGPRQPGPHSRGPAAGAAQDRRRIRDPEGMGRFRDFVRKGPRFYRTYRRQMPRAERTAPRTRFFGGNGSSPAFQGPGL